MLLDAVLERGGAELRTRIASRLLELREDVLHRRHAELRVGELLRPQRRAAPRVLPISSRTGSRVCATMRSTTG